jgi:hypothetical protein
MAAAIAEQPGAEMRDLVVVGGAGEGQSAAFDASSPRPAWNSFLAETTGEPAASGPALDLVASK